MYGQIGKFGKVSKPKLGNMVVFEEYADVRVHRLSTGDT